MAYRTISNQLEPEIYKINNELELLEESICVTDECVADVLGSTEKIVNRKENLEEDVLSIKVENVELKKHLNGVIIKLYSVLQELNAINHVLNNMHIDTVKKKNELEK